MQRRRGVVWGRRITGRSTRVGRPSLFIFSFAFSKIIILFLFSSRYTLLLPFPTPGLNNTAFQTIEIKSNNKKKNLVPSFPFIPFSSQTNGRQSKGPPTRRLWIIVRQTPASREWTHAATDPTPILLLLASTIVAFSRNVSPPPSFPLIPPIFYLNLRTPIPFLLLSMSFVLSFSSSVGFYYLAFSLPPHTHTHTPLPPPSFAYLSSLCILVPFAPFRLLPSFSSKNIF